MTKRKRARLTEEKTRESFAVGLLSHLNNNQEDSELHLQEIDVERLSPNPFQPRQTFDLESLKELSSSIKEQGFYGHLWARQKGRKFELAFGERRCRAAKLAGLPKLPIEVRTLTDEQMLEIALTENIQREDLHPVEEAKAFLQLKDELGYSIRKIAQKVGKSVGYVASLLSLLRYPEITQAVYEHNIPVRTAEELAKFKDPQERQELIKLVIEGKIDRQQLIELRRGEKPVEQSVRNANTSPSHPVFIPAFHKAVRALQKQDLQEISGEQREETASLLQQIIDEASSLLKQLKP